MSGTELVISEGTPASVIQWEEEIKGAHYLFKSGLCPVAIKTPEAALFIILAGRDLGLSPVAALRNINIIQGKVELNADMQLALFHRAGGKSTWAGLTAERATLRLTASWLEAPHVSDFSMEDARRAGISGGDNWKKYPKAMLRSRAITQGLKDIGFDATAGVYAPGELGGEAVVDDATDDVKPAAAMEQPETGEAASQVQIDLYVRSLKSPIWTDEERDDWTQKMQGVTKKQMSQLLEDLLVAAHAKKAAQYKAAKEEPAGATS